MANEPTTVLPREEEKGPKGIGFFNVKSGETHYAKLEPQIQAFINSSDMGINASRGQDFGWKLSEEWVRAVRAYRRDEAKMDVLTAKNGNQKPTTTQILYAIYSSQVNAARERDEENETPFLEEYQAAINGTPKKAVEATPVTSNKKQ